MLWKNNLIDIFGDRLKLNHSLKMKSSLKTGGISECFLEVLSKSDVVKVFEVKKKSDFELRFLGRGSNTLIRDHRIEGLVIQAINRQSDYEVFEDEVEMGACVYLPKAIQIAHEHGLIGLEFASGIPGTIGGAVKMNAGTKMGEIKDCLSGMTLIRSSGIRNLSTDELKLTYRHSNIKDDTYIYRARFKLKKASATQLKEAKEKVKEYLSFRNNTQPLNKPNLGSTFVNPPSGFAAKLIEECGLKGYRVGDIGVSTLHANFIVNHGLGTSAQATQLIEHVQQTVLSKTGVALTPEIKLFG